MVARVVFWSCFGVAVRWWQLGLEMRPFFQRKNLWTYPAFAAGFGSFGYWLQGVDKRQNQHLDERKKELLEKRARKAARDGDSAAAA
jgi:hypothetical protein